MSTVLLNVIDRERYSMLNEEEQKVFDEIHEYFLEHIAFEEHWREYIDAKNVPKMPDIGDFTTLFETILDEYEEAQDELENERDRADIAVDQHEEAQKESDLYHAALCNIENCDNMDEVNEILQRVLYR